MKAPPPPGTSRSSELLGSMGDDTVEGGGGALCPVHGLRYAPGLAGCVLCRREASAEIAQERPMRFLSPYWIALPVAGLVGMFAWRMTMDPPGGTRVVVSAAMEWGTRSPYAECSAVCADAHIECDQRCDGRADVAECGQFCLGEADHCFGECKARFRKADLPWSFRYASGEMPEWSAVLLDTAALGAPLLECSAAPIDTLAYVRVPSDADQPISAQVWKKNLDDDASACLVRALVGAAFPRSEDGDYAVLAPLDSRYDRLRLGIAQTQAEIDAAARKRPEVETELLKSRLFDAKVVLSKQNTKPLQEQEAALVGAQAQLVKAKEDLRTARTLALSRPRVAAAPLPPPPPPPPPPAKPPRIDDSAARARAAELKKQNDHELEHYRQVNREYRKEERRTRELRAWQGAFDP